MLQFSAGARNAALDAMDAWNKGTHGRSGLIDRVKASTLDEAKAEARGLGSTLRGAYEPALPALALMMAAEVGHSEAYRTLARAIGAGDPEAAQAAARQLLEPATRALTAALIAMEERP